MGIIREKLSFFQLPREDLGSLIKAFFFFYFVLCAWYSIRPVRNEMAVQAGLENLPGLFVNSAPDYVDCKPNLFMGGV